MSTATTPNTTTQTDRMIEGALVAETPSQPCWLHTDGKRRASRRLQPQQRVVVLPATADEIGNVTVVTGDGRLDDIEAATLVRLEETPATRMTTILLTQAARESGGDEVEMLERFEVHMRSLRSWSERGRTCKTCGQHKALAEFAQITGDGRRRHVCTECRLAA